MWITRNNYYGAINSALAQGREEGRKMLLIEQNAEKQWSRRIGTCTRCQQRKPVIKNRIEGGQDCYNCASNLCMNITMRHFMEE